MEPLREATMSNANRFRRIAATQPVLWLSVLTALLLALAGCGDGGAGSGAGAPAQGSGATTGHTDLSTTAATNPDGGTTTTGQGLDVLITPGTGATSPVLVGSSPINYSAKATLGSSPPLPVNFLYILDLSGSMNGGVADANGDGAGNGADSCDRDGVPNHRSDAACFGLIALNKSLGSPVNVQVGLIGFASTAASADMSPAAGVQVFTTPDLDSDADGQTDVEEVVHSAIVETTTTGIVPAFNVFSSTASIGTATDYHQALLLMNNTFAGRDTGDVNIAAFISDGEPTAGNQFTNDVSIAHNHHTVIHTFAIGDSFAIPPCNPGRPLRVISDGTGGTCTVVDDPGTLQQVLPDALTTRILSLDLTVNGTSAGSTTGEEPVEMQLNDVDVSALVVPGSNLIQAIATARDGTVVTAETTLDAILRLDVTIDIKPGSDVNPINLKSKGKVPVAILGSATFDVSNVDPTTVQLAGSPVVVTGNGSNLMASFEDVNGDGYVDLLVHVATQDLNLSLGDAAATLTGALYDGTPIQGSDTVRIVH
jgi:hypothetical protein